MVLVNRTIDDPSSLIVYGPPGAWRAGDPLSDNEADQYALHRFNLLCIPYTGYLTGGTVSQILEWRHLHFDNYVQRLRDFYL
jgi:hypothetical protein